MTYATKAYNLIQYGRESTAGTGVAATKKWRGPAAMVEDARTTRIVEEDIGLLVPNEAMYDTMVMARLALPQTDLNFEQICDLFEMGIGTVTPTDNTGSYTYDYAFATGTTPNTIKTYTFEAGNVQVSGDTQEMNYTFAEEITLSGKHDEGWMMQASLVGQKLTQTSFTGSVAIPAVNFAPFNNTKLYIDASGGTIGSTQKSGTLMAAEIRIQTGIRWVPVGNGNLFYSAIKYGRPAVTFSLTIEVESGGLAAAQRTAYINKAIQLVRLNMFNDATHQADIDMAIKWDKVNPYDEEDENVTVVMDGHAVYSSTDTLFFEASVTNEEETL